MIAAPGAIKTVSFPNVTPKFIVAIPRAKYVFAPVATSIFYRCSINSIATFFTMMYI